MARRKKRAKPVIVSPIVIPPARDYPASVVAKGLQSVWDLRSGGTGPRSAAVNVLGVDNLPGEASPTGTTGAGHVSYSGGLLVIRNSVTFNNWNFDVASHTAGTSIVNDAGITVTFNDCYFGLTAQTWNPSTSYSSLSVGLQIGTVPSTIVCNYCKWNGARVQSDVGVDSPWNASAVRCIDAGSLTLNNCQFINCPHDVIKNFNCVLTVSRCLLRCHGWNQNADGDKITMNGGVSNVDHCMFDASDGAPKATFPGIIPTGTGAGKVTLNTAIYAVIENNANLDCVPTVTNNIVYGWSEAIWGVVGENPTRPLIVADRHTPAGVATGKNVINGVWTNNVIQKGSNGGAAGYWQGKDDQISTSSIATWSGNIDFDDSSTIALPVFPPY